MIVSLNQNIPRYCSKIYRYNYGVGLTAATLRLEDAGMEHAPAEGDRTDIVQFAMERYVIPYALYFKSNKYVFGLILSEPNNKS
jgi:hypothetical protein